MFCTTFVPTARAVFSGTTNPSDSRCATLDFAFGLYEPPCRDDGCADGSLVFRASPCTHAALPTPPGSVAGFGAPAPDVAFANGGQEIVVANGLGIGRWNLTTGSRSKFLAGQHDLFGLASKSELALTLGPGGLCVFDLRRFQPVRTLQRIATAVFTCGCWSPDDRRVATGHDDGSIHLWDVATGMELVQFEGHSRAIRQLAFSPDGTRLYSFAPRTSTEPEARSELFVWNAEPAAK